ncbi:hypothetical protein J7643_06565 [bacterium]|nr:hypothetical protein [bacterium]
MPSEIPDTIETSRSLYQALTARPVRLGISSEEVLRALAQGAKGILVELPWGEGRHQIVVTQVDARRIRFFNAQRTDAPAGTVLGAPGPERRVEANGEESMDLVRFVALFAQGGKAMLQGA